jgi:uncharacterized membrane protein affecting hemolysin expression
VSTKQFIDMSVRRKLTAMLTITMSAALLMIALAFIACDHRSSQHDPIDHLATPGKIVADNSGAVVAFNDSKLAEEVLTTLRDEPEIQSSCIYDQSRRLLAQYHRGAGQSAPGY